MKYCLNTTVKQFQNYISDSNVYNDFIVEIGEFSASNRACCILDDTYYIRPDYIYFRDKRKLSKWEVEMKGLEESLSVKIATNYVGSITSVLNIVEFLIQYSLLKKGISIVHASGVARDGKCIIFPARSGGGKTTVALSLLERGFQYLGDNYVILDKGVVRNFISPLNIFSYNRMPFIDRSLSIGQKISLAVKKMIYDLTGGYFKVFEKIDPVQFFGHMITDNCTVHLLCQIDVKNHEVKDKIVPKRIGRENLMRKLRYNMELDMIAFSKYIYSYGYAFPNSIFSNFWEIYEKILKSNIPNDLHTIAVEVPDKWSKSTVDKIIRLLGNYV
jgi:hypothetical protein